MAPRASRVALLLNPDNPNFRNLPGALAPAATQLGLTLITRSRLGMCRFCRRRLPLSRHPAPTRSTSLKMPTLAGTSAGRKQVSEWALKQRLPVVSSNARFASDGGLLSFGTDLNALNRRAAGYVDKVLKGAKPADLPVERPSTFNLSVNVKTAKALGLTIRRRCCCAPTR